MTDCPQRIIPYIMPFDPLVLGRNITARREALGLTQRELGVKCGATQVAVSFWENGTNQPSLLRLALLADALNITIGQLLGENAPNGDDRAAA